MRLYKYTPDEWFDCGELGEHEIELTALINSSDWPGDGTRTSASIVKAVVNFDFGKGQKASVDFTNRIKNYPEMCRRYEEMIAEFYVKSLEKTPDDYYDDFVSRAE